MWLGKFAVISYIFSIALFGIGLMLHNAIGVTLFLDSDGNNTATADNLIALGDTHEVDVELNPNFLFGDHVAALVAMGRILFDTVTGGIIFDALSQVPFFNADASIMYIFRAIITLSSAFLFISIIANRNI